MERNKFKAKQIKVVAIIIGVIAIVLGILLLQSVQSAGWPFGDKTEYDRAVEAPFTLLAYASMASGLLFFCITKRSVQLLVIAMCAYFIIFFGIQISVEYYFKNFTDINYGQGG
jgi:hypothetical protein